MGTRQFTSQLHLLLKECYQRPHSLCRVSRRSYSTDNVAQNRGASSNIAVLGGGITGLTAAYLLSRKIPSARITLFESQERLGGWLQSTEVDTENGRVIFEQGPRTLRPVGASGLATLDLIRLLGIENETLATPKHSPAARYRFIYYPDHLVRMPYVGQPVADTLSSIMFEPLWEGIPSSMALEFFREPRYTNLEDESVGSFLRRRMGAPVVDNIVSAILHGIYAGDVDQLSVKSLMPLLWENEKTSGSLTRAALSVMSTREVKIPRKDMEFMNALEGWHDEKGKPLQDLGKFRELGAASVYTFKGGLAYLSAVLEDELEGAKNVTVRRNIKAVPEKLVEDAQSEKVMLRLEGDETTTEAAEVDHFDYVISTFNPGPGSLGDAAFPIPKATVMVVNLHFRSPSLLPVQGFGYLLPRSIPFSQNPERALGVVFDSDATQGQDSATGTKVTVMMGGHWWQNWDSYPNEQDGYKMARSVLRRHLGIQEEPDAWKATLQVDCIPQYHVGHSRLLKSLSGALKHKFRGRLRVAGAEFHGISVNDCVRSAYMASRSIEKGEKGTGLEDLEVEWLVTRRT